MKRPSTYLVALMLLLPGVAGAQDRSPIPDHWLTLDSLSAVLGLNDQQKNQVSEAYGSVNRVLQEAAQRRTEIKASFEGTRPVSQMSEDERKALTARLESIRVEYVGRQADLDQRLADVRTLLSSDGKVRFDGLEKPRLVPAVMYPAPKQQP